MSLQYILKNSRTPKILVLMMYTSCREQIKNSAALLLLLAFMLIQENIATAMLN